MGGSFAEDVLSIDEVCLTDKAREVLSDNDVMIALLRHSNLDWGIVDDEIVCKNEEQLKTCGRVASCFGIGGTYIFVVTDIGDTNKTEIMLATEVE